MLSNCFFESRCLCEFELMLTQKKEKMNSEIKNYIFSYELQNIKIHFDTSYLEVGIKLYHKTFKPIKVY